MPAGWNALEALLAVAQGVGLATLLVRLMPGRTRLSPVAPATREIHDTTVSVLVPTLNEAARIRPLLTGLAEQRSPLIEVLVIDSGSRDDTANVVREAMQRDPRVRLLHDPPLPLGWIGKVWALQHGLAEARGEWVLGLDADVEPVSGLVAAVVGAARQHRYSVVSFSPCFAGQTDAEQLLQPAMLRSLIYRTGAPGSNAPPDRVLANGQCFLARKDVLLRHGGYAAARESFSDDVTLARHLARAGERVGFLDGSMLYRVRAYASAAEMWREWGRSIDLTNATSRARQWLDVAYLAAVQGLPLPMLLVLLSLRALGHDSPGIDGLVGINATLVAVQVMVLVATRRSYARRSFAYWCSWLCDPLAALRIAMTTAKRPRRWRGREYPAAGVSHPVGR